MSNMPQMYIIVRDCSCRICATIHHRYIVEGIAAMDEVKDVFASILGVTANFHNAGFDQK